MFWNSCRWHHFLHFLYQNIINVDFCLDSYDVLAFLRWFNEHTRSFMIFNKNHTTTMQISFRTVPNAFRLEMLLSELFRAYLLCRAAVVLRRAACRAACRAAVVLRRAACCLFRVALVCSELRRGMPDPTWNSKTTTWTKKTWKRINYCKVLKMLHRNQQ